MNLFVADPGWGWWIIGYFFLGGIAAGAYFLALLIDLAGGEGSRNLPRVGYWIAFPLICVCGLLLTADLERPERFWHMLLRSEVVDEALSQGWPWGGWGTMLRAPLLKTWSPMSVGSWALMVFGFCSGLSFLGSLWEGGRLARWFRRSWFARVLQAVGCLVGFFVAAYTGTLLSATNQPVWSDSPWIAPLFLTSAASTGAAAMLLVADLAGIGTPAALTKLDRADVQAILLELLVFAAFLASLELYLRPVWETMHGKVLILGTLVLGLGLPLVMHLLGWLSHRMSRAAVLASAVCALLGGLLLRYGILTTPPELLAHRPAILAETPEGPIGTPPNTWFRPASPEDGRQPEQRGADPDNRSPETRPQSKVFKQE